MSWTNDVVLEFLDLYRREQHLWDPKHPLHRNRSEVSDAWLRIQTTISINCSIIDLKRKKESLMTSFRMHWNKKKKSPEYRTTWFAYPLMESFLGGKYECDSTNQLENEFFSDAVTYTGTQIIPDPNTSRNNNTHEKISTITKQRPAPYSQANPTNTKFNKSSSDLLYAKKQIDNSVNYYKNASNEKKEKDEYELYGQLLAKKLRKLDEHQRDVAMHEIDNIMFRAKMQSSPAQPRSYSSSPSPVPRKLKSPLFIITPQSHQQYEDENMPFEEQNLQPQPHS